MSYPDQPDHYVRRVRLASGREIEVVYFHQDEPEAPPDRPNLPATQENLHICRECESNLVYPVEWEEDGKDHWEVLLRCPNCEWRRTDSFLQADLDRFDEELDRGTDALVRDLKRLTRMNMELEVEKFTRALAADAILPEDF